MANLEFDFDRYKKALSLREEYQDLYPQLPKNEQQRFDNVLEYLDKYKDTYQQQIRKNYEQERSKMKARETKIRESIPKRAEPKPEKVEEEVADRMAKAEAEWKGIKGEGITEIPDPEQFRTVAEAESTARPTAEPEPEIKTEKPEEKPLTTEQLLFYGTPPPDLGLVLKNILLSPEEKNYFPGTNIPRPMTDAETTLTAIQQFPPDQIQDRALMVDVAKMQLAERADALFMNNPWVRTIYPLARAVAGAERQIWSILATPSRILEKPEYLFPPLLFYDKVKKRLSVDEEKAKKSRWSEYWGSIAEQVERGYFSPSKVAYRVGRGGTRELFTPQEPGKSLIEATEEGRAFYRQQAYKRSLTEGVMLDMMETGVDLSVLFATMGIFNELAGGKGLLLPAKGVHPSLLQQYRQGKLTLSSATLTGKAQIAGMQSHLIKSGLHAFATTPGEAEEKLRSAIYRIAYTSTPYIVNHMQVAGWNPTGYQAIATDLMLNTFLTSPTYVDAFMEAGGINSEFLVMALPQFMTDLAMSLNTRGDKPRKRATQFHRYMNKVYGEDYQKLLDFFELHQADIMKVSTPEEAKMLFQRLDEFQFFWERTFEDKPYDFDFNIDGMSRDQMLRMFDAVDDIRSAFSEYIKFNNAKPEYQDKDWEKEIWDLAKQGKDKLETLEKEIRDWQGEAQKEYLDYMMKQGETPEERIENRIAEEREQPERPVEEKPEVKPEPEPTEKPTEEKSPVEKKEPPPEKKVEEKPVETKPEPKPEEKPTEKKIESTDREVELKKADERKEEIYETLKLKKDDLFTEDGKIKDHIKYSDARGDYFEINQEGKRKIKYTIIDRTPKRGIITGAERDTFTSDNLDKIVDWANEKIKEKTEEFRYDEQYRGIIRKKPESTPTKPVGKETVKDIEKYLPALKDFESYYSIREKERTERGKTSRRFEVTSDHHRSKYFQAPKEFKTKKAAREWIDTELKAEFEKERSDAIASYEKEIAKDKTKKAVFSISPDAKDDVNIDKLPDKTVDLLAEREALREEHRKLAGKTKQTKKDRERMKEISERVSKIDDEVIPELNKQSKTKITKPTYGKTGEMYYEAVPDSEAKLSEKEQAEVRERNKEINHPDEKKIIRKRDIINTIKKRFDVTFGIGKFRKKNALALYKVDPEIIRTKVTDARNINVATHELGHHLDKLYKFAEMPESNDLLNMPYVQSLQSQKPGISKGELIKEGVAEFIRYYVTDESAAREYGGKFFDAFERSIVRDTRLHDNLLDLRSMIFQYGKQDRDAKIRAFMADEPRHNWISFHKLYENIVSELHPLYRYSRWAIKSGVDFEPGSDPYKLARVAKGWQGRAELFVTEGGHKRVKGEDGEWKLEKKTKGIREIQDEILIAGGQRMLDDFTNYWVSKRALELESFGKQSGMDKEQLDAARDKIREVEASPDAKFYIRQVAEIVKFNRFMLNELVDAGFITKEAYDRMIAKGVYYHPYVRIKDEAQWFNKSGNRYGNRGKSIYEFRGANLEILNPWEASARQAFAFTNITMKNEAMQALVDSAKGLPGHGRFFDKIPTPMRKEMIKLDMEDILNKMSEYGYDIENASTDIKDILLSIYKPNLRGNAARDVVSIWRDGKPEFYSFNDRDLMHALLQMNVDQSVMFGKFMRHLANWTRVGHTVNPRFIVYNPARDQFQAAAYSKHGYKWWVDFMSGAASALGKDDSFKMWLHAGGAMKSYDTFDKDYGDKMINMFKYKKMMKRQWLKATAGALNPMTYLKYGAMMSEYSTNIGETKRALKAGKHPVDAAFAGRDITVDHGRKGAKMKPLTDPIAFLNAGIQGIDKFGREMRENPGRTFLKFFTYITLPSIALQAINQGDPAFEELPEWRKTFFWNIPVGKGMFIPYPKPHLPGFLFGTMPEIFMRYLAAEEGEKQFEITRRSIVNAFSPNLSFWPIELTYEWQANTNFFTSAPIVPRYEQQLPPGEQAGPYTSETAKLLGSTLGISPRKIDHSVGKVTGILGRSTLKVFDSILRKTGVVEDNRPASKLVETGLFIGDFTTHVLQTNSATMERFYNDLDTAETALVKKGKLTKKEREIVPYIKALREISTALGEYRRVQREVHEWPLTDKFTAQDKRNVLDYFNLLQINLVRGHYGKEPLSLDIWLNEEAIEGLETE